MWIAYDQVDGLPDPRWDAAQICSVTANVQGNKTTPEDFLPRPVEEPEPLGPDESVAAFQKAMQVFM